MQSSHAGLIRRNSSAALSMAQSHPVHDPLSLTVAQELLNQPNHTRQRSTFTIVSSRSQHFHGIEDQVQAAEPLAEALHEGRSRRAGHTSNTWTSSSGDVISDQDEIDDRTLFVQEYNRLARKHGVRNIVPEEHEPNDYSLNSFSKQPNWFSRKILRRTSSSQSVKGKNDRHLKHMRSISDSLRNKKRDKLKDKDLQDLARLCGLSLLYLPTEYAAGSLAVPTCVRATAQFLIQHAPSTRGVFRIPGSQNAVAALYNHYCSMDEEGQVIAGTVRCPTLPDHIRCDTHDVASAFKKFLAGLPGGILGSLALFNAFISIQTQFQGDAELTRTKQSKVRARLIALAVATLRSQYRRELICAVFGLLSMIGRAAETAPREDERGRPLPTSDLMGYCPLGIVFGPLLVGDLLEDYTIRLVNPHGGLILLPISPPKSRKERSKKNKSGEEGTTFSNHIDKIKVANGITEMLITHWRDVVRHMKNLSALKVVAGTRSLAIRSSNPPMLRPSASETFALRKPPDWDNFGSPLRRRERSVSPTPNRHPSSALDDLSDYDAPQHQIDSLKVKKQRGKQKVPTQHAVSGRLSKITLSPTREESPKNSLHQGLHSSESQPRSDGNASGNATGSTPPNQEYRKSGRILRVSNESSDKENHHPSGGYQSILDPGSRLSGQDQLHRVGDQRRRDLSESKPASSHTNGNKNHNGKSMVDASTSKSESMLEDKGDVAASPAKPFAPDSGSKSRVTPNKRSATAYTTRKDSTEAFGSGQPSTNSPREPNKLTKSAERTPARENGIKVGLLKGKYSRHDGSSKKSKKNKSSAEQSSASGADSKHSVGQNMHDKFWPFDRKPGTNTPDSRSKGANLDIMITRSSSQNLSENPSGPSRRAGGSEPALQPHGYLAAPNYRRASRSLDDSLQQRRKITGLQQGYLSKDPLSRVSHEEDVASLAELAKALDSVEEPVDTLPSHHQDSAQSIRATDVSRQDYQLQNSKGHKSPQTGSQPGRSSAGNRSPDEKNFKDNRQSDRNAKFDIHCNNSASASISTMKTSQPPQIPARTHSIENQNTQLRPRKSTGSPRSPSSKILALVAKYNNGNTVPTTLPTGTSSPFRSPPKVVSRDPSTKIETSKEGLIAPYTINPPTPTRSQMSVRSGKSDKPPQSQHTPEAISRPSNPDMSPSKIPAPRKVLRASLDDKTPLRPVQKIDEIAFRASTGSPSKIPRARFEDVGTTPDNVDGSVSKRLSRGASLTANTGHSDQTALVVARLARSTSRTLTPPPMTRRSVDEVVTDIRGPRPSLLNPAKLRSVQEASESSMEASKFDGSAPTASLTGKPEEGIAYDGPAGEMNIHPYPRQPLQLPPIRASRHVSINEPEFVHPDSPFHDTFSRPGSPASSPTGPSNAVLYHEIKSLQKQLYIEREETLQLRQQLDARSNLDLSSLNEELRETKKELEKWKTRAKVAEKQLEIMAKQPSRSLSTQLAYNSASRALERIETSRTDCPSDSIGATHSLRKFQNGTDGAASSDESQNSTNTVIRDEGGSSDDELEISVEQPTKALGWRKLQFLTPGSKNHAYVS